MNASPRKLNLDEWDDRYEQLRRDGLREPGLRRAAAASCRPRKGFPAGAIAVRQFARRAAALEFSADGKRAACIRPAPAATKLSAR